MSYASQKNIPGLLLFIDFEKAFDSLEWSFIERTLQYFGFGSSLKSWFQTFYKNIESCVLNNGWASGFFQLQRGVRQGCLFRRTYLYYLLISQLKQPDRTRTLKEYLLTTQKLKLASM